MKNSILLFPMIALLVSFTSLMSCGDKTPEETVKNENSTVERTYYPVPAIGTYPKAGQDFGFVNVTRGAILRAEASRQSPRLTTLPIFTLVYIIDDNGPQESIGGLSGAWLKVNADNRTGWIFGPLVAVVKNSASRRSKPDFNTMKLSKISQHVCCGCGGGSSRVSLVFSGVKVVYTKEYGDESGQSKTVQEGIYTADGDEIRVTLNEGKEVIDQQRAGKKIPGKTFSFKWNDDIQGFTDNSTKKYLSDKTYFVDVNGRYFFKIKSFVACDACVRSKAQVNLFDQISEKDNDPHEFIGYYGEVR